MHSLAAVDLNLIVALHALLEEGSVTGAARRVGLSQPAMSHALSRLREHFGDPLLIRSGRGMTATPRGRALLEQVRPMVRQLEGLMAPPAPSPTELSTSIRLAADDYIGCTLLPRLIARLQREAPGIQLDVVPRGAPGRKAMVRRGTVDLAIGHFSGAGMDLSASVLAEESWVCVLRAGHPALGQPLTPAVFAALPHAIVSPTGGRRGVVDRVLAEQELSRAVTVALPHFIAALSVVAASDHILTTPRGIALMFADSLGLVSLPPPVALPDFTLSMLWHARTEHDPAQRWLRQCVAACF
jgi:DNA-binding transcriptional LysR family regulator